MGGLPPGFTFGMLVQLGSLVLNQVDANGVYWYCASPLDGWDSPEVRYSSTDRESDHGSWVSPTYAGSRPVTLTGTVHAPSAAALDNAREQVLAAASYSDTTLTVYEATPKQCTVRRSGKTLWQPRTDRVATYSLLVTAPDPRRYAVAQQSLSTALPSITGGLVLPATLSWTLSAVTVAGSLSASNVGSFETRPVFTIAGPVSQPQVAVLYPDGTERYLTYTGPDLLATDQLVIDTDAHTVTEGGASRRRWLQVSGGWPDLPANSTAQILFRAGAYSSSALLTATWRSAWI